MFELVVSYFMNFSFPLQNLIMNGIFSAIPYVAYLIIIVASGPLADFLRKKQVSTVIIRKLFTCTG